MKTKMLALIAGFSTAAMMTLWPGVSSAQISQEEVKQQLEREYGVMVLQVRAIENRGKTALAVTMMNPPGNFNEAYQVNTIVIDPETGKPVLQYFGETSGVHLAAPPVERRTSPMTADNP